MAPSDGAGTAGSVSTMIECMVPGANYTCVETSIEKRDGAVVHERDLHVGAEAAGRDRHPERGELARRTRR